MRIDKVKADVREIIERFKMIFAKDLVGCESGILMLKKVTSAEDYFYSIPILEFCSRQKCVLSKLKMLRERCEKKVNSLYRNALDNQHVSSCQGRCEENPCRPGAIVAGEWIYAFDGLPDHMNELLVIEVALRQGALGPTEINEIMSISKNTLEI